MALTSTGHMGLTHRDHCSDLLKLLGDSHPLNKAYATELVLRMRIPIWAISYRRLKSARLPQALSSTMTSKSLEAVPIQDKAFKARMSWRSSSADVR